MSIMASLEFNGSGAGEIKRHPEVEVLPVARGNRTERMKKVLNWLKEGGGLRPRYMLRDTTLICAGPKSKLRCHNNMELMPFNARV
jgi:hypothetical protein